MPAWTRIDDAPACVLDALAHHLTSRPSATAILDGERRCAISYAQLEQAVGELAGDLEKQGIGPGDRVGVLSRDAVSTVMAMLAIWRVGGVYVGLNNNLIGGLLQAQFDLASPRLLLVQDGLAAPAGYRGMVARLPEGCPRGAASDRHSPVPQRDALVDAAIVFTSGTTGPAKGVRLSHRWICHYTFLARSMLSDDDVVYCDLPLYHVGGAFSLVVRALWKGVPVAVWNRFSADQFWDRIRWSGTTTAILLDVMTSRVAATRDPAAPSTLRAAHLQPLPEDFRGIAHRLGLSFVTCGYGQTEAGAVCAAAIAIDRDGSGEKLGEWRRAYCTRLEALGVPLRHEKDEIPAGFMGAPSPLLEVSIVEPDGTKSLPGAVGELQVRQRSPGLVMTGYLGQTRAVSSNDPLSSNDRVRDLGDGTFAFVERANGVMRVRGENVSGAEVERVILGFEGVLLAHVLGVPAREGHEEEVVALVVMKDGQSEPIPDLQRLCAQALPKYMRPTAIWCVEDLPLTSTGKVDRAAARQIALGLALPDLPTRTVPEIKS